MTLEAALSLPVFLFAVISILSFTEILRSQMEINSVISDTAKELSVYGHAASDITNGIESISLPAGIAFSELYVRNQIIEQLSEEFVQKGLISRLSFGSSKIMENDLIELRCVYTVKPYFALSEKAGFRAEASAVARAFTGYDNLHVEDRASKEEYVYITQTGHAYHKSRSCHYLDLSIREADRGEIESLRNQSGSKYYACPLCAKNGMGGITYITDYGDCYHYDLLCSGLKRTVKAVLLSEVGGRTPCSKCCR